NSIGGSQRQNSDDTKAARRKRWRHSSAMSMSFRRANAGSAELWRCADHGIGRHARLQLHVRIGHGDLDAVHQLDPFLLGLHVLGGELRLGGDETDAPLVNPP